MRVFAGPARLRRKTFSKRRLDLLQKGLTFKVGDIITTCTGYNEIIKDIQYRFFNKCRYRGIADIDIYVNSGLCSFVNCCTVPILTKQEIIDYFKSWTEERYYIHFSRPYEETLEFKVRNGIDVFDERGCLLHEHR